jgi:hypothetical protein
MPLTDTHLVLLSRAAQNDDGLITPPDTMSVRTLQAAAARLLRLGLVEEVPVRANQPHWRTDEDAQHHGLRITPAGLHAIGIEPEQEPHASARPDQISPLPSTPPAARVGSKRALLIDLLRQDGGTTLQALAAATGWLPHTTRAALTGLRKAGHEIARDKAEDGTSTYRILPRQDRNGPFGAAPADEGVH